MSLFDNPDSLKQLQDLLNPKDPNGSDLESDEDEVAVARRQRLTPATIVKETESEKNEKITKAKKLNEKLEQKEPQSIEEWQQLHEKEDAEILDTRKVPTYNIAYRQAVGTEDVYFQMNNRTNSSASCEDMVLEISLSEETVTTDKMDLAITEHRVELSTPVYHLKLPLPQPINVDRSRAKYDSDLKKLTLTLRMKRELDFVNF